MPQTQGDTGGPELHELLRRKGSTEMWVLNTFMSITLKFFENFALPKPKLYPAVYKEEQGYLMLLNLCPHMAPAGHQDVPVWAWIAPHTPDLKFQSNSNSFIRYQRCIL